MSASAQPLFGSWKATDRSGHVIGMYLKAPFTVGKAPPPDAVDGNVGSLASGTYELSNGQFDGLVLKSDLVMNGRRVSSLLLTFTPPDTLFGDTPLGSGLTFKKVNSPAPPPPPPPPTPVDVSQLIGSWRSDDNPIGDPMETLEIEQVVGLNSVRGKLEDYSRSFSGPCSATLNGTSLDGSVEVELDLGPTNVTTVRRSFSFQFIPPDRLEGGFNDSPYRFTLTKSLARTRPHRAIQVCYDYAVWRMTNFGEVVTVHGSEGLKTRRFRKPKPVFGPIDTGVSSKTPGNQGVSTRERLRRSA